MIFGISRKPLYILMLCLFCSGFAAAGSQTDYMAIMMSGQKIGHAVHTRTQDGDRVITQEEFSMTLGRAGQVLKVHSQETHTETVDGRPLAFEAVTKTSGMEQVTRGTIQNGTLTVTRQVLGQTTQQVMDWPQDALLMEGMRLFQLERGLKTGDRFEVSIFRPEYMAGLKAVATVGEKTDVDLFGRVLKLTEIQTTMTVSNQQITSTSYVDDELNALKTLVPMMGMTMELLACDKTFALQDDKVVDFLEKLSVASPAQLTQLKKIDSVDYLLKPTAAAALSLPTTSHQTAIPRQDGLFELTVRRLTPETGVPLPYDGPDEDLRAALAPTDNLQCNDKAVIDLAKHAVGGTQDAAKAAKQIESFVAGYIQKKDLSVGYASAAEVAQSRQGDCSEHAVLTAAMCRAAGIPARVVCGVLYVDSFANQTSIFGGHMWVEARIGDQWIGLDATRVDQGGFGPGHLALATGNGDPGDFFSLVNTLGCFTIEAITPHLAPADKTEPDTAAPSTPQ